MEDFIQCVLTEILLQVCLWKYLYKEKTSAKRSNIVFIFTCTAFALQYLIIVVSQKFLQISNAAKI